MGRIDRLVRKARADLGFDGEVHATVLGYFEANLRGKATQRNGVFIVTGSELVLYSRKLSGHVAEKFDFQKISSIETGKTWMGHFVAFSVSGSPVSMKWISRGDFEGFVRALRQRVPHAAEPSSEAPSASAIDQLKKLEDLLAAGVLTQAEFDAKKHQVLVTEADVRADQEQDAADASVGTLQGRAAASIKASDRGAGQALLGILGISAICWYSCGSDSDVLELRAAMPPEQVAFLSTLESYRNGYENAPTAVKKSELRDERDAKVEDLLHPRPVKTKEWRGILQSKEISSYDGSVSVEIEIGEEIVLSGLGVEAESQLFAKLARLEEGDAVVFSGFLGRERSFFEESAMLEPEFGLHLSSIRRPGEAEDTDLDEARVLSELDKSFLPKEPSPCSGWESASDDVRVVAVAMNLKQLGTERYDRACLARNIPRFVREFNRLCVGDDELVDNATWARQLVDLASELCP